MDDSPIRKMFPRRQVIKLGQVRIGLFHGEGAPEKIVENVMSEFKNDALDIIIFGHSHKPFNEKKGGVLYFNPGSPNDMVFAPYRSYGLIEIREKEIKAQIIKV